MLQPIPRRRFLALLAGGLSAAYVEQHIGLWERVRSYFMPQPNPTSAELYRAMAAAWAYDEHGNRVLADDAIDSGYRLYGVPIFVSPAVPIGSAYLSIRRPSTMEVARYART